MSPATAGIVKVFKRHVGANTPTCRFFFNQGIMVKEFQQKMMSFDFWYSILRVGVIIAGIFWSSHLTIQGIKTELAVMDYKVRTMDVIVDKHASQIRELEERVSFIRGQGAAKDAKY